jgi:hypothetical protein
VKVRSLAGCLEPEPSGAAGVAAHQGHIEALDEVVNPLGSPPIQNGRELLRTSGGGKLQQ